MHARFEVNRSSELMTGFSLAPRHALFSNIGCILTENRVVVEQRAIQLRHLRHLRAVRRHRRRLVASRRFHHRIDRGNQGLFLFAMVFQGRCLEAFLVVSGPMTAAIAHAKHHGNDQQKQRGHAETYGERQTYEIVPAAQSVAHDGQSHVSLRFATGALRVTDIVTLIGGRRIDDREIQPVLVR